MKATQPVTWACAGVSNMLPESTPARPAIGPRGVTLIEAVVLLVIIAVVVLLVLVAVPQGREQARLAACRANLGQIGLALMQYEQISRKLPTVGELSAIDEPGTRRSPGPLRMILDALQLPDLLMLKDAKTRPEAQPELVPGEIPVPGFICSSDPNATSGRFAAPISYRASTGAGAAGDNGAFSPGRVLRLQDIDARDGLSYTAGFSERLVGDAQPQHVTRFNYQVVLALDRASGCSAGTDPAAWRGDAGSSWTSSDYRHSLYNHALPPGGHPSCIVRDGKTAFMGASSGHTRGVNVLMLDGAVNLVRPSIDQKIWKELAQIGAAEPIQVAD
jgi:prepilin-type processing-associated H-X9-DG protein